MAPGLEPFLAYKHLLDALSGWVFDLNVCVEAETALDVTTHLAVWIACKRSLQVFLQHRDNFLARQLDRGDWRVHRDHVVEVIHCDLPGNYRCAKTPTI